jgi:exodeoxyribonuclease-3
MLDPCGGPCLGARKRLGFLLANGAAGARRRRRPRPNRDDMLIATFNCNSIRVRLETILAWLAEHRPDVLALQETKCPDESFPADAIREAGWHVVYRGEKSYNGVAVLTAREPDEASFGLGDGDGGESGTRLARVRLGDVHVLNTYVPQGWAIGSEKFRFKLDWLARLRAYVERNFDAKRSKLIWAGDLNVAPTPADVYDPKRIWPHVCFCQEVIDAFENVAAWGFVDVFRKHIPQEGVYTYWDYRIRTSVRDNLGWRIDHVLATAPAAAKSTECFVDFGPRRAAKPSDHTFVAARFET